MQIVLVQHMAAVVMFGAGFRNKRFREPRQFLESKAFRLRGILPDTRRSDDKAPPGVTSAHS